MYTIYVEDKIYYVDSPRYVKKFKTGYYQVPLEHAEGLFYEGKLYSLPNLPTLEDKPLAIVKKVDAGVALSSLLNRLERVVSKIEENQEALCDLSVDVDAIEEALCDLSLEVE